MQISLKTSAELTKLQLHGLILEVLAGAEHGVAGGALLRLGHIIPGMNPVQLTQAKSLLPEACVYVSSPQAAEMQEIGRIN